MGLWSVLVIAASAFLSMTWFIAAADPEHKAMPSNATIIVVIELTESSAKSIPTKAHISIM
jgi:hypothetical protein